MRVSSKVGDIFFYPLERLDDIQRPVIARVSDGISGLERGMSKPTQGAKPVIDTQEDQFGARGEIGAMIQAHGRLPDHIASAVNPEEYRPALGLAARPPDIEVETVFAPDNFANPRAVHNRHHSAILSAGGAKLPGFLDALPWPGLLGRLPAKLSHRRRGIRHPKPNAGCGPGIGFPA